MIEEHHRVIQAVEGGRQHVRPQALHGVGFAFLIQRALALAQLGAELELSGHPAEN